MKAFVRIRPTSARTSTAAKQVMHFIATGSYYRRFVKGFATIAKPLSDLTKKDCKFEWTDRCQEAFDKLKGSLTGHAVIPTQ